MLHSRIYNEAITNEMKDLFRRRDVPGLLALRDSTIVNINNDDINPSRLQVILSMIDSIKTGGKTTALITDFINV